MAASENIEEWQLSEYERQRSPHALITDDTEVTHQEDAIFQSLICPICLNLTRNAVATTVCLHRFCEECIATSLSQCNECPVCRTRLPSNRPLRRDNRLDALVAALFPDAANVRLSLTERVPASLSRQPHDYVEHGVRNRKDVQNIAKESAVIQKGCGEATRGGLVSTVVESGLTAKTDSVDGANYEADIRKTSLDSRKQLSRQECHGSQAPNVSTLFLSSGRDELPQGQNTGVSCAGAEVLDGKDMLPKSRIGSREGACFGPNSVFPVHKSGVDYEVHGDGKASLVGSVRRKERTRMISAHPYTGCPERANLEAGADARAAGTYDCGSSAVFAAPLHDGMEVTQVTLKPFLETSLKKDPSKP